MTPHKIISTQLYRTLPRLFPATVRPQNASYYGSFFRNQSLTMTSILLQTRPFMSTRWASTHPPPPPPLKKRGFISRLISPYTTGIINAPISNLTAFLIAHQTGAFVSLGIVWYLFNYFNIQTGLGVGFIPDFLIMKGLGVVDKLLAWTGWGASYLSILGYIFGSGEGGDGFKIQAGGKAMMQGAAAYAIVKMLFPVRLVGSVIMMPWFARWIVIPFFNLFKRAPKKSSQL